MIKSMATVLIRLFKVAVIAFIFLNPVLFSCTKDDPNNGEDTLTNDGSTDGALLVYYNSGTFNSRQAYSALGSLVSTTNDDNPGWEHMTGVQVGKRQFVVSHEGLRDFAIRLVNNRGQVAQETQSGTWGNSYETLFGFHVGDRGFIFGQDGSSKRWFTQEILKDGRLAANESDHGSWRNYYAAATPIYDGNRTFLFFQMEGNDNYWFTASVSPDGVLTEVEDGYWNFFWERLTSVTVAATGGGTYLIGMRVSDPYPNPPQNEIFIQQVYSDGKMGPETDRIYCQGDYKVLVGYESGGHAYFLAYDWKTGNYIIREIKPGGNSVGVSSGSLYSGYDFMIPFSPFNLTDPDGFRYTIGWDCSNPWTIDPDTWSTMYSSGPWSGEIKFGGGAALAQIDGDGLKELDAVLVGIDDNYFGTDRFYYKVAWNLQNDGQAKSWSKAIYSPTISLYQAGAGADIADIDGDGRPDLLLMYIDDPDGVNQFRYHIGWNLAATTGQAASWSSMIVGPAIGNSNQGGGVALGDIDKNGRPDLVLMGVDNPEQSNYYWFVIGKNLNKSGIATSWTPVVKVNIPIGWYSEGGGAALADFDGNGKLDLMLMRIDNPTGSNYTEFHVGLDIDINGTASRWVKFNGPSLGYINAGGGLATGDINKDGKMDILLMALDNPYGKD